MKEDIYSQFGVRSILTDKEQSKLGTAMSKAIKVDLNDFKEKGDQGVQDMIENLNNHVNK